MKMATGKIRKSGAWRRCHLLFAICFLPFAFNGRANPTGMTVTTGTATASQSGSTMTINTSQFAALNWQTFNIAAGETTIFNQPSASSIVLNRINDPNPSQIFGSLQANGIVVLMNSAGVYFGPNSYVHTGGLIVSTANCLPPAPNSGGNWVFNGPPPLSSIANFGRIDVAPGGPAYLIAENVLNYGTINAPGGNVGLAAGQQVVLSQRPDGRGLSMTVNLPDGSVNNEGHITADAGTIAMSALSVNQNGFVQANSVRDVNGVIELVASDSLDLGASSHLVANGDGTIGGSSGGNVMLQSGNTFSDAVGSRIDATGGSQGGNGGNIEISAPNVLSLNSIIDALASSGWLAGTLLLDPGYITLDTTGAGSAGSGTILAGSNPGSTLDLNVNTALANLGVSDIILQAQNDITLATGTAWDLSGTIGANLGGVTGGQLTLQAGRNIIFGEGSSISDANDWSVALSAGVNDFTAGTVQPGMGSIYLNGGMGQTGGGFIQTAQGNINLTAGQDITVGSGYVITTGGGSINAHALAGNIDTGSDAQGYHFESAVGSLSEAYDLSGGLGGISTANGGDVTLIAGGNVTSVLPTAGGFIYDGTFMSPNNSDYTTAGVGTYGTSASGNVTVVAGGNVTGHYLVANGTGNIFAGVEMDANGNPVQNGSGNYALDSTGSAGTSQSSPDFSLGLINGGWNVAAAQDIILQEVNNPNGVFDTSGGAAFNHYFDYGLDDYVNLSAGNLVQLGASSAILPRPSGIRIPFIYPSILNITTGAGGVTLVGDNAPFNQLILFPSPAGSLTINTTGSLIGELPTIGSGNAPQIFNLIISDSGSHQYRTGSSFGLNDHAATPVHLGSETPVVLNVGGDMNEIFLGSPEAAQITVGGDMNNCGFQGMNLAAGDVTSINVNGDIFERGNFTSIDLSGLVGVNGLDLSALAEAIPGQLVDPTTLAASFSYDPVTKILTYQNISGTGLLAVLNLLNHLTVQKYINGVPQWEDPPNDTIPMPADNPVSVFGDPTQLGTVAYALLAQYNQLGAIPNNASANGFFLGGGGQFNLTARSMDLGTSAGIVSKGVGLYKVGGNYPLASLFGNGGVFDSGAGISITTTGNHSEGTTAAGDLVGDLDLYSSSVATLNGGNVSISTGGDVNAGSAVFSVNTLGVRGIYTTSGGDVSVTANGDVNVNGSRIATYDGGNLTLESLNGNINAGSGASLPVAIQAYYENPVTHTVYFANPQIPFSGILALTLPSQGATYPEPAPVLGNVLVEAPNGAINARAAGILQIPLNLLDYPDATTMALAGYELRDNLGNPLSAAGIADGAPVLVSPDRDINVSGSGIIAGNANLDASGNITGLIFARNNVNINAQQNINVTAFGVGNVTVSSAGGTISGTLIGVNGVNASGVNVDASLISANVSGATSGQSGLGQGAAAAGASQGLANNQTTETAADSGQGDDEQKKKKGKEIALARKVSRVTVILPPKKLSENKNSTPGT